METKAGARGPLYIWKKDGVKQNDELLPKEALYGTLIRRIGQLNIEQQRDLLEIIERNWGKGRRKNNRKAFFMTVDYVVDGKYYRDFIQDVSSSGIFIKTRQKFEVGKIIWMTFMAPDFQMPYKISGKITRTLERGFGVQFIKESPVHEETIAALINKIRPMASPPE